MISKERLDVIEAAAQRLGEECFRLPQLMLVKEVRELDAEVGQTLNRLQAAHEERDAIKAQLAAAEAEIEEQANAREAALERAKKAEAERDDAREVRDGLSIRAAELERQLGIAYDAIHATYGERNRCVAALAQMAVMLGWRVGVGKHPDDPNWDAEWRTIIFIDLPTGQASWHVHDSEAHLFDSLPPYEGEWDGHSTPEKYERLAKIGGSGA